METIKTKHLDGPLDEKTLTLWLTAIIILAVLLRVGAAFAMGNQVELLPGIHDQVSYDLLAQNVLAGNGFSFDRDWWPVTQAGEPTAHWSYLMTLYLSVIYHIFGYYPLIARLIQAILAGIFMPWLTFRITHRVFSKKVPGNPLPQQLLPLLAAAWVSLYGYFIYYSAALMTETFHMIGIFWSLDCAMRIISRVEERNPKKSLVNWLWVELGASVGVAVLMRQVYLLFVPFLLIWLWWSIFKAKGIPLKSLKVDTFGSIITPLITGTLMAILVIMIMILPFTVYNYIRFDQFVLLNSNAGYAFFWANHPIHGYKFVPLFTPDMPSYQSLIPQDLLHLSEIEIGNQLMKLGIGFVVENPLRFLILTISRIPEHFIFWPLESSPLQSNINRVGSLGLALPFSLIGLGIYINDLRQKKLSNPNFGILLLLFFVIYVGIYVVSWAGIRYRLPADPVLVMFAAYGLLCIVEKVLIRCTLVREK